MSHRGMLSIRALALYAATVGVLLGTGSARAAAFGGFSVVVERDGGSTGFNPDAVAYGTAAHAIFIDEFDPYSTGVLAPIQSLALPQTDPDGAGPQRQATMLTNGTTTGFMTVSGDFKYLVTTGFTADAGSANTTAVVDPKAVARIDLSGNIDTSTTLTLAASTPRNATSVDGSKFYVQGSANARYLASFAAANGNGTTIESHPNRVMKVIDGRLWLSSTSTAVGGGAPGVFELTTSVPDRSPPTGSATVTTLINITGGTVSGFTLADLNPGLGYDGTSLDALYVADQRATGSSGGVYRYDWDGTAWNLNYRLTGGLTGGTMTGGVQDITYVGLDPTTGSPVFFATTVGTAGLNALAKLVDDGTSASGIGNSAFVKVIDAPANTVFRGVAAIPEPGSASLVVVGAGILLRRRRH